MGLPVRLAGPALPTLGQGGFGGALLQQALGSTRRLLRTGETGGVHLQNGPSWAAPLSPGTVVHSAHMSIWWATTVEGALCTNARLAGNLLRRQP